MQKSSSRLDQILNFSNIDEMGNMTTGSSSINLMKVQKSNVKRAARNISQAAII